MDAMETTQVTYKSPVRKLLPFFQLSRDKWKAKHHTVKQELIKHQHQVRAVEKSRAAWRSKAEAAQQRVRQLEQQLAEQKGTLQ